MRYSRPMTLQKSVSAVLTEAPDVQAFPGAIVVITASRYAQLVDQIVALANQSGYTPTFTKAEAWRDLSYRGYRAGVYSQSPTVPFEPTQARPDAVPFEPPEMRPTTDPIVTIPVQPDPPPIQIPAHLEIPEPLFEPDAFQERKARPVWIWIAVLVGVYLITR